MLDVRTWQVLAAVLALTTVATAVLTVRWQRRHMRFAAAAMEAHQRTCDAAIDEAEWLRWWIRCACETPHSDPARELFLRWAIAGAVCPGGRSQLHCDLQRLAGDANQPEHVRVHALAMASEMDAAARPGGLPPWRAWEQAQLGQPAHNPHALAAAYRAALDSWASLLPCLQETIVRNSLPLASLPPKRQ